MGVFQTQELTSPPTVRFYCISIRTNPQEPSPNPLYRGQREGNIYYFTRCFVYKVFFLFFQKLITKLFSGKQYVFAFSFMFISAPYLIMGGNSTAAQPPNPVEVSQLTQADQGDFMSVHETTLVAYQPTLIGRPLSGQGGSGNHLVYHTVQDGETVSLIAEKYNISANTIFWANDISSAHDINTGDVLNILPINGALHRVQNGETLVAIAREYDVKVQTIVQTNDLEDSYHIFEGQELLVPGARVQISTTPTQRTFTPAPTRPVASGYFIRPAVGRLTQGPHAWHPNAVDIANPCYTHIRAAASGTVSLVSAKGHYNGGYGNYIIVDHSNGTRTLYAHLATHRPLVVVNQQVNQGQVIGYMGTTGRSTGCHLHFEVHGAPNPIR